MMLWGRRPMAERSDPKIGFDDSSAAGVLLVPGATHERIGHRRDCVRVRLWWRIVSDVP
jgi:hypothetical protein